MKTQIFWDVTGCHRVSTSQFVGMHVCVCVSAHVRKAQVPVIYDATTNTSVWIRKTN